METLKVNGAVIEYTSIGVGEPMLLIHGGLISDAFATMAVEPALRDYQVIWHRRRGYQGSPVEEPVADIALHAQDAAALLRHLDVGPAHVVGHCYGGCVALELALTEPELVATLSLLEAPAPFSHIDGFADVFFRVFAPILAPFSSGDRQGTLREFGEAVLGMPLEPDDMDTDAWRQLVADIDFAFSVEVASLPMWSPTAAELAALRPPTLYLVGGATDAVINAYQRRIGNDADADFLALMYKTYARLIPDLRMVEVPGLTHALQMQDPRLVAEAVAAFVQIPSVCERRVGSGAAAGK